MTEFIKLSGEAHWAKVYPENRDMEGYEGAYVDCDGCYTIDMKLDDHSLELLKKSGSKAQVSAKSGMIKFKRKHAVFNRDGEIIEAFSGKPQVVMDGKEINFEEYPIGNGSSVTIAVTVTPDKKKSTIVYTRLEGVEVTELVEYTPEDAPREMPF